MMDGEKEGFEVINGMKIPLRDRQQGEYPKRFYGNVFVEAMKAEDSNRPGHCVKLDRRILKSPEKVELVWPSRALAQRVAEEWDFQEDRIRLHTMPLTTLSYSALGRQDAVYEELRSELLAYAGSDLIVYRSERPHELVTLQQEGWDPVLAWLEQDFAAPFNTVQGIGFVDQPPGSLEKIRDYLAQAKNENLPAMMSMTKLSGSVFLSMAVVEGHLSVSEAWPLAMIDEDWQNSQWGRDSAQKEKLVLMNRDFAAAADFVRLYGAA